MRRKELVAHPEAIDVAVLAEIAHADSDGGKPLEDTATKVQILLRYQHATEEEPVFGIAGVEGDTTFQTTERRTRQGELRVHPVAVVDVRHARLGAEALRRIVEREIAAERRPPRQRGFGGPRAPNGRFREGPPGPPPRPRGGG